MRTYVRLSLLLAAVLAVMGGLLVASPRTGYSQLTTREVVVPVEWEGRSKEDPASVPSGDVLASKVNDGFLLQLDEEFVFDNGLYTPQANKNATPADNDWASWPQWHGQSTYQVRHLQASFTLPTGLSPADVVDVVLFSPFYKAQGDIIPINDNVYVELNGQRIGTKGTSYGALNDGMGGSADFANETDGWYADGSFGSGAAAALQPGTNVIDIVAEEFASWGGIGRLDLKLVHEIIEVDIDIKPGSYPNCLNNDGHGVIPVAILGSADFDVTQIDPETVRLDSLEVRAVGKSGKLLAHIEDVNGDGFGDLVVQIQDADGAFVSGAGTATVTGRLYEVYDGTLFEGIDEICIVP